jgi:hypothetical protein
MMNLHVSVVNKMNDNNKIITATLSLTKQQWESIIQHIMNDASVLEIWPNLFPPYRPEDERTPK